MRQGELLGRVVAGAVLRISRDPWGKLLPGVNLVDQASQCEIAFVHGWQIRKMLDSGLLEYDGDTLEDSSLLRPTVAGLATGNAWHRARTRSETGGHARVHASGLNPPWPGTGSSRRAGGVLAGLVPLQEGGFRRG